MLRALLGSMITKTLATSEVGFDFFLSQDYSPLVSVYVPCPQRLSAGAAVEPCLIRVQELQQGDWRGMKTPSAGRRGRDS
jgi:hypothetical protein